MITENVSALKIHKLTQDQYDTALASGSLDESALYLTPFEDAIPKKVSDLENDSGYVTQDYVDEAVGSVDIPSNVSELTNDSGYATQTYVDNAVTVASSSTNNEITFNINKSFTIVKNTTYTPQWSDIPDNLPEWIDFDGNAITIKKAGFYGLSYDINATQTSGSGSSSYGPYFALYCNTVSDSVIHITVRQSSLNTVQSESYNYFEYSNEYETASSSLGTDASSLPWSPVFLCSGTIMNIKIGHSASWASELKVEGSITLYKF